MELRQNFHDNTDYKGDSGSKSLIVNKTSWNRRLEKAEIVLKDELSKEVEKLSNKELINEIIKYKINKSDLSARREKIFDDDNNSKSENEAMAILYRMEKNLEMKKEDEYQPDAFSNLQETDLENPILKSALIAIVTDKRADEKWEEIAKSALRKFQELPATSAEVSEQQTSGTTNMLEYDMAHNNNGPTHEAKIELQLTQDNSAETTNKAKETYRYKIFVKNKSSHNDIINNVKQNEELLHTFNAAHHDSTKCLESINEENKTMKSRKSLLNGIIKFTKFFLEENKFDKEDKKVLKKAIKDIYKNYKNADFHHNEIDKVYNFVKENYKVASKTEHKNQYKQVQ